MKLKQIFILVVVFYCIHFNTAVAAGEEYRRYFSKKVEQEALVDISVLQLHDLFLQACKCGSISDMRKLLEQAKKEYIDLTWFVNLLRPQQDQVLQSAISVLILYERYAAFSFLFDYAGLTIDVNLSHGNGFTPLMYVAVEDDCEPFMKLLLDHGADSIKRNIFGYTALMCALVHFQDDAIQAFVKVGMRCTEKDFDCIVERLSKNKDKRLSQAQFAAYKDAKDLYNRLVVDACCNSGASDDLLATVVSQNI